MNTKDLKLDYFKFYDVTNQLLGESVALQGQFDCDRSRCVAV